ncbi:MAG: hypothetical protein MUP53_08735, partial [Bacteroidales bacterium]|nr:hypothetical protein [Bacteroidales bacterium]
MRKGLIVVFVLAGLVSWNCSRTVEEPSLKNSLEDGAAKINSAISVISRTNGYDLMTLSGDMTKSETDFRDSITLDLVAGIYDFKPDTFFCRHYRKPFWSFTKSGESDKMVVNLPQWMVLRPKYLFNPVPPDTVPVNDFTITASDYHFYYSFWNLYDYRLSAGFALDSEDIGRL